MKWGCGIALALSLAANFYFALVREVTSDHSTAEAPAPARSLPVAHSAPRPPQLELEPAPPASLAKLDRATLEKHVTELEAKLERLLPLNERFERGERRLDTEQRLKPFFDKVFMSKADAEPSYAVECHDDVCKLTGLKTAPSDWTDRLQKDPAGAGLFSAKDFGRETFLKVVAPGPAAGNQLAVRILTALRESEAVAECKKRNPTPGTLTLELTFEPATKRVGVNVTGPLANQASGLCIRRVVEEVVAAAPVPPETSQLPKWPLRVEVPSAPR